MALSPRQRVIQLTEDELQAMLNKAVESGAEKVLEHFGVYSKEQADKLRLTWDKVNGLVGIYENVSKAIGKGVLNLVMGAVVIILGIAAGIKMNLIGGAQQ